MNSYDKEIYFHIPGAFERSRICLVLIDLMSIEPHLFKDNAKIGSAYGAPGGIWNGGRLVKNGYRCKEDLTNLRDAYKRYSVPVRFTYTNPLITGELVHDAYCNLVLDVFNNGDNEIICNSTALEEYLRDRYGDSYKYISSTTKRLADKTEQLQELERDYYLVVLDYDHNHDYQYLESIENKDKCEILVNPVCMTKCPKRVEHYLSIAKSQLEFLDYSMECPFAHIKPYYLTKRQDNYISPEDINNKYIPMGFTQFKIEGRTANPLELIEILVDYLVKEEYKLEVRMRLHTLAITWDYE